MAEYKTTVALEIGAQSVTLGVFTPSGKNGFALSRYARRDIVLDPVEEGMRIDYVSDAVKEMVAELKVKGSEVRSVVSGQQVFMRFMKLLVLDSDSVDELVGYEAQQHIPFPLDEIVYSYQLLGTTEEGEREVLLVAIKKEVLDELHEQVRESDLRPQGADCSVTSLYNVYRASYPDEAECTMILDIGAKTTDIIFAEAENFFTRSVTASGGFITSAISREMKIGYREAEELKVTQGLISMGNGHTDSMDEQQAALATIIRTAMTRVSTEVQRTINHYRAQRKGGAPTKVLICGGGSRLPFTLEFLQENLSLPVEYFNPIAAFAIGKQVDPAALEQDALCLGSLAGAAVTGARAGVFHIDLVPTVIRKQREESALLPKFITAGAIALAGAAFFAWSASSMKSDVEAKLNAAQRSYDSVSGVANRLDNVAGNYEKIKRELEEFYELEQGRTVYIDILKQIMDKSPSTKFWITEFSPLINYALGDDQVDLTGPTFDVPGTRLIDMKRSRSAQESSSINNAPEAHDSRSRNKDPQVTAIYVSGYLTKTPGDTSVSHQDRIRNLVNDHFDDRSKDSLFSFKAVDVQANLNKYFRFIDSKEMKREQQLDYVEKFMMIMPLKEPISIPELSKK